MAELTQEQTPACAVHEPPASQRSEARTRWVVVLTVVMMIAELIGGYLTNSMALTADGWHMATHVGALGLTAFAYWYARTRAGETRFAFGTGKVYALAGYTSAVFLLAVSGWVAYESLNHLVHPETIKFAEALPVAVLGLGVNIASAFLLDVGDAGHSHGPDHSHAPGEAHDHDHDHPHEHTDHNLKAAYLHVVADALTSVLAIVALVAGRFFAVPWLDAAVGIVGSVMIARWGVTLTLECARQLIDLHPLERQRAAVQKALEQLPGTKVCDLHLWSVGPGRLVCVATVMGAPALPLDEYRQVVLAAAPLAHLTIEVR